MNLLRQAEKLGVKKFGLISSVSVSFNPANPTAVVGEKGLYDNLTLTETETDIVTFIRFTSVDEGDCTFN